jgi:hypothetical protein
MILTLDQARNTRPATADALHDWVRAYTGISIARHVVCEGHAAPFDLFARQVLERPSLSKRRPISLLETRTRLEPCDPLSRVPVAAVGPPPCLPALQAKGRGLFGRLTSRLSGQASRLPTSLLACRQCVCFPCELPRILLTLLVYLLRRTTWLVSRACACFLSGLPIVSPAYPSPQCAPSEPAISWRTS